MDFSNYATKADIKNILQVDTSSLPLTPNLASLKTEVDKLDIVKLLTVAVDLSKLRDIAKNDVIRKTVYDKLVAKVNSNGASGLVLKPKYHVDKSEIEKKISDTSRLVKKTDYNAKITEIDGKIPSISDATN